MKEIIFLNALNHLPALGPITLSTLKKRFGSWQKIWQAPPHSFDSIKISAKARNALKNLRHKYDPQKLWANLEKQKIWMIDQENSYYPKILAEIPASPIALYGKGEMALLSLTDKSPAIAVVGTRKPTKYGCQAAEYIVRGLAKYSFPIISGLAVGIDAIAHKTALSENLPTIAVLGSAVDESSIFPAVNRPLAKRIIAAGGAVISEYPPGRKARKENFPQRNRIISGISKAVIVVEAGERSGALITARLALDQNREVFSVPGSIFSKNSYGTNKLLLQGAAPILAPEQILEQLGITVRKQTPVSASNFGRTEKTILALLAQPQSVDVLKEKTGLDTPAILTILSKLELQGIVKKISTDEYQTIT